MSPDEFFAFRARMRRERRAYLRRIFWTMLWAMATGSLMVAMLYGLSELAS